MGEKTEAKHMQGPRFDSFPAPQEKSYNFDSFPAPQERSLQWVGSAPSTASLKQNNKSVTVNHTHSN